MEHNGIVIWNQLHQLIKMKKNSYTLPSLTEFETRVMHVTSMIQFNEGARVNVTTLKTLLNVSHPTISQTVSNLEEKGYLRRVKDPHDGRVSLLEVSDVGRAALKESYRVVTDTFVAMADHIGEEKSRQFIAILKDMIDYFRELGGQE